MADKGNYLKSVSPILQPATAPRLPVPIKTWNLLMKRIRDAVDSSAWYAALGWWLLGVGMSSFLTTTTFAAIADFGTEKIRWAPLLTVVGCGCIAAIGMVCGIVTLCYAKQHREDKGVLMEMVLEDMQNLADDHPMPS